MEDRAHSDFQVKSQRRSGIISKELTKELSYYFHTEESLPHPTPHILSPVSLLSLCKVIQLAVSKSHFLYLTNPATPFSPHGHCLGAGLPPLSPRPWPQCPDRCPAGPALASTTTTMLPRLFKTGKDMSSPA